MDDNRMRTHGAVVGDDLLFQCPVIAILLPLPVQVVALFTDWLSASSIPEILFLYIVPCVAVRVVVMD